MNVSLLSALLVVSGFMAFQPLGAVIVGGVNGNGTNNAGDSTLQSYLTGASLPSFPFWNNMVNYNDASAAYLGYNPTTMQGWVISAQHINEVSTITVDGNTYTLNDPAPMDPNQNGTQIGSSDIVLYSFSVGGGNPIPSMPTVPLPVVAPTLGETMLMIGRGSKVLSDETAPYTWNGADNVFRWGTNLVEGVNLTIAFGDTNKYLGTVFSEPVASTDFDGQAVLGDSGGGMFILRGGVWYLSGGLGFVADGSDTDAVSDPAGYGDISFGSDFFDSRAAILAVTGTLVPEPSSAFISILVLPLLLLRRSR